jgi:ParE toxin of type II toxin-antitoxin system, parDE
MASIEVTRRAREELRALIAGLDLPGDTRDRVSRSLLTLEQFPRSGKPLSGVWRDCRAIVGPWGWLLVVYMYVERDDQIVVIGFRDGRSGSSVMTSGE